MPKTLPREKLEQILIGMIASSRNLNLYPPDHPLVTGQVQKLFADMEPLFGRRDKASVAVVEEVLVFEGVPFYQPNIAVREFQRRIEERGVTAVEFHRGLTVGELLGWAQFLVEDNAHISGMGATKWLADKGIAHIKVRDVREVYNRAIDTISDVLGEVRMGRIPSAENAKSVVADLTEYLLNDRPALLALTLLKSYDNYLFNHSVNVSVLSLALAEALKAPAADLQVIGMAGLLHDIGKTMTPKSIILKPHQLTPEEWGVMREHPVKSSEIVAKMPGVGELCVRLVYEHHINFDRKGYPAVEAGRQLHPYSKIITISDVYDAVTTLRPYQKPFSPRDAMRIMESLAGRVIDPVYFREFIRVLGIYPVGSLVRLDTGEVAVVTETRSSEPLCPKIKILFDHSGRRLEEPIKLDLAKLRPGEASRNLIAPADPLLYGIDPFELLAN